MAITSSNSGTDSYLDPFSVWKNISSSISESLNNKRSKSSQLESKIINFLVLSGNSGKTRNDLVEHLDFPRTTVYDSLNRLYRKGLIEIDHKLSKKGKGRPQTIYFLKGFSQGLER